MADDTLENFRLSFMNDALPVGIALADRFRKKGFSGLAEAFTSFEKPLKELQKEGEPIAKSIRDNLDEYIPGLGNPIIPVEVFVDEKPNINNKKESTEDLNEILISMEKRLDLLSKHLNPESKDAHKPMSTNK
tara:strand:+ start:670 stop:1068 length:399 start_codon:yes stop_codon:yes gene_type:complete